MLLWLTPVRHLVTSSRAPSRDLWSGIVLRSSVLTDQSTDSLAPKLPYSFVKALHDRFPDAIPHRSRVADLLENSRRNDAAKVSPAEVEETKDQDPEAAQFKTERRSGILRLFRINSLDIASITLAVVVFFSTAFEYLSDSWSPLRRSRVIQMEDMILLLRLTLVMNVRLKMS